MISEMNETLLIARDYDLAATLTSGQAFRWIPRDGRWESILHGRYVSLQQLPEGIEARTLEPQIDWDWLREYLQIETDLDLVLETFPKDAPMQTAVRACRGLRLLRQEPWECLASFILSSTKQIVQIQQIVKALCECYGGEIAGSAEMHCTFPLPSRLATLSESNLRSCKMGFRAPYLLETARIIDSGKLDLEALRKLSTDEARLALMGLPGVGEKIANCVLLFAYGFQDAFPVDVWVQKAIAQLYFPKRRPTRKRLKRFVETHFGPNAGYAQQYLFHYMRTRVRNAQ